MAESRHKTELFLAVGTGDLSKVKSIVDFDISLLAEREKGRGPIMAATESGKKDVADFLAVKALYALRRRLIPKKKIGIVIHDLGEGHVTQAVGDIAKFLRDEDRALRYEAVNTLAFHLDSKAHRPEFERMLFEDADEDVRMVAARGLGYVLRRTRNYRAARLLLKKLHDSGDDGYVRLSAYEALQMIWLPEADAKRAWRRWHVWPMYELSRHMSSEDELQWKVDWAFVESVQQQVEYVP